MDLAAAEHAVSNTLLWHLRVLAGWAPSRGLGRVRLLAGGFEIANVARRLQELAGAPAAEPFQLGALSTAWSEVSQASSKEAVRSALASSAWGDPGAGDVDTVAIVLQASWTRRVASGVPEAAGWARILAAMILARMLAAGAPPPPESAVARNLRSVLGGRWDDSMAVGDLSGALPVAAAQALAGVRGPDDLWLAEAHAWALIEQRALQMQTSWRPGPAAVVAVAGLLAVDAWRVRAALEIASRGGSSEEVLDVVA